MTRFVGSGLVGAVGTDLDERLRLAAAELERIGVRVLVACVPDRMVTLGVPAAAATNRIDNRPPRQRSPRRWSGRRGLLWPRHLGMRTSRRKGGGRARQPQRRQPARERNPTHRRGASHMRLPWRHTSILLHLLRSPASAGQHARVSQGLWCPRSLFTLHPSTHLSLPTAFHICTMRWHQLEWPLHGISKRLSR